MILQRAVVMLGIIFVAIPAFALLIAFLMQRSIFYPAPSHFPKGPPFGFERIETTTADGLQLSAGFQAAIPGKPTLVFFHGNGDNLAGAAIATKEYADKGLGVLLVEYRGYAGNPGAPSEAGLYLDAEAAMAWLRSHGVAPAEVILMGNSMGSGAATEMAVRHRVGALILISGFSSLPDVVADHYAWLPAQWIVRDRYDSASKLSKIQSPILLVHGDADQVVPIASLQRLSRANGKAEAMITNGLGHEIAYLPEVQRQILAWINANGRSHAL